MNAFFNKGAFAAKKHLLSSLTAQFTNRVNCLALAFGAEINREISDYLAIPNGFLKGAEPAALIAYGKKHLGAARQAAHLCLFRPAHSRANKRASLISYLEKRDEPDKVKTIWQLRGI